MAEVEVRIERGRRRCYWAQLALGAAAVDLLAAGELGAITSGTAEALKVEAKRVAGLVERIEGDRGLEGDEHRVRDTL